VRLFFCPENDSNFIWIYDYICDINLKMKTSKLQLNKLLFRNWIQFGFLALTLFVGTKFYFFVEQLERGSEMTILRPSGVEGFLPIGSLMGWKLFFAKGIWDPLHPAGMVILGFAIIISFLSRKAFCSWFCPIGTLCEWFWKLGKKLFGRNFSLKKWLDIPLRSLKYILMVLFVGAVLTMSAQGILAYLEKPYMKIVDIKMLYFFTKMTFTTGVVLLILIGFSLFIKNFWCRYLCPYGALLGLFSMFSPTKIVRNEATCTDCGLCSKSCPADLPVDKKLAIYSAECTGCMDCTLVCPAPETLHFKTSKITPKGWTTLEIGILVVGLFLMLVGMAKLSGNWQSQLPIEEVKQLLPFIDQIEH